MLGDLVKGKEAALARVREENESLSSRLKQVARACQPALVLSMLCVDRSQQCCLWRSMGTL